MRIHLHKLTPLRHRFECTRADGTRFSCELETRSCLRHDLMHWAYERRAGLAESFYGTLERGADPSMLRMQGHDAQGTPRPSELQVTEVVVGMLQGASMRAVDPARFVPFAKELLEQQGHGVPAHLTADLVRDVLEHYRKLVGRWDSLRGGGILELDGTFAG